MATRAGGGSITGQAPAHRPGPLRPAALARRRRSPAQQRQQGHAQGRRSSGGPNPHGDASAPLDQPELPVGDDEHLPEFVALDDFEAIGWDYLATGHSVRGHPLEPHREQLAAQGLPDAGAVNAGADGSRVSYAGLVICRQRPSTAGGVVFMTLEDESGFVNCVVWAKVFERYRTVILSNVVLGVSGVLQSQEGVVHLIVESCWKPRLSRRPAAKQSRDFH
jgi:error-prone DNA polymerase